MRKRKSADSTSDSSGLLSLSHGMTATSGTAETAATAATENPTADNDADDESYPDFARAVTVNEFLAWNRPCVRSTLLADIPTLPTTLVDMIVSYLPDSLVDCCLTKSPTLDGQGPVSLHLHFDPPLALRLRSLVVAKPRNGPATIWKLPCIATQEAVTHFEQYATILTSLINARLDTNVWVRPVISRYVRGIIRHAEPLTRISVDLDVPTIKRCHRFQLSLSRPLLKALDEGQRLAVVHLVPRRFFISNRPMPTASATHWFASFTMHAVRDHLPMCTKCNLQRASHRWSRQCIDYSCPACTDGYLRSRSRDVGDATVLSLTS